jgi:hypothetical protein
MTMGARLPGHWQTGVPLGERLKEAWEWAAVMGQVELYGWQKLDMWCCPSPLPVPHALISSWVSSRPSGLEG